MVLIILAFNQALHISLHISLANSWACVPEITVIGLENYAAELSYQAN